MVQDSHKREQPTAEIQLEKNCASRGISVNRFQACGYVGLASAIALTVSLVWYLRLSYWIVTLVILTTILTFLTLTVLTEVCTGKPRLVYYRCFLAAMGSVATLVLSLGHPLLPYLDVAVVGIGLFVACGRMGCLLVGCCHGRPFKWGVRYREADAAPDFPEHLTGIPLFPVQAVESCWVLVVVLIGVAQIINGQPSGSALSTYIVGYGVGRFCFEFLRGDVRRRYLRGISEAQWTSVLMTSAVVTAEWYGALSVNSWHSLAAACLVIATLIINMTHAASDSLDSSIEKIELYSRLEIRRGTSA